MSDPNNPYNLRGVMITPNSDPSVHYFLCVIDVRADSDKDVSLFSLSNPQETGRTLSFQYNGNPDTSPIYPPVDGQTPATIVLPVYYNQNIDLSDVNALTAVLTWPAGAPGMTSTGIPNSRKPPKTEPMVSDYQVTSTVFQSASNSSCQFIVFLADTGSQFATDLLTLGAYPDGSNSELWQMDVTFNPQTPGNTGAQVAIGSYACSPNAWTGVVPRDVSGNPLTQIQPINYTVDLPFL